MVLTIIGVALAGAGALAMVGALVMWPVLVFTVRTTRDRLELAGAVLCLPIGLVLIAIANGM